MSYIMKTLGVENAEEWASLAWQRPADNDQQACDARREGSNQMIAAISATGFVPDNSFLDDVELLVSGRMTYEEHRAYLEEKYKEPAL